MELDPSDLRHSANIIDTVAGDVATGLYNAIETARDAEPGFPGDAAGPFSSAIEKFESDRVKGVKSLIDMAEALVDAANKYESMDSDNAASFESAGAGVDFATPMQLDLPDPVTGEPTK